VKLAGLFRYDRSDGNSTNVDGRRSLLLTGLRAPVCQAANWQTNVDSLDICRRLTWKMGASMDLGDMSEDKSRTVPKRGSVVKPMMIVTRGELYRLYRSSGRLWKPIFSPYPRYPPVPRMLASHAEEETPMALCGWLVLLKV